MPGPTVPSWLSLLPLSKWRLTLGHAWASGRSVPHVGARSPCTGCLHGLVEVARGDRVRPARAFGESQDRCRLCRLPSSGASVEAEAASSVCPLFSPPLLGCPAGRGTFWKNVNLFSSCKTHMQELASKSRRLESWIKQQENCRRKQGRRCRSSATSLCPVKAAASPGLSLPSLRVSLPVSCRPSGCLCSPRFSVTTSGQGRSLPASEPTADPSRLACGVSAGLAHGG